MTIENITRAQQINLHLPKLNTNYMYLKQTMTFRAMTLWNDIAEFMRTLKHLRLNIFEASTCLDASDVSIFQFGFYLDIKNISIENK